MSLRPRQAGPALAVLLGASVFVGTLFSPAGEQVARRVSPANQGPPPAIDPIGTPTTPTAKQLVPPDSIRRLLYDNSPMRAHDVDSYGRAMAALPPGHKAVYVMGSSEFSAGVDQNPNRFLLAKSADFDLFESGRGATDPIAHALELAAVAPQLEDHKVVLLVSAQWFKPKGVNPQGFGEAFSTQQWQRMLDNPKLSAETRRALVSRSRILLKQAGRPRPGGGGADLDDPESILVGPLDQLSHRSQELKDLARSAAGQYQFTGPFAVPPTAGPASTIDWAGERKLADAQARKATTTNPYGINDRRWAADMGKNPKKYRDVMKTLDYTESPVWSDLQLFLDVARENDVKVMMLNIPMNGPWYDFMGYDSQRRAKYYDKLAKVAADNHVEYTDFRAHEYEKGFLWDASHLGWKGWLDATEACYKFAVA